jgi:DNA gyrase/topoisomerase IV subunit B
MKANIMIRLGRGIDANNAGKENRSQCFLYITDANTRHILDDHLKMDRLSRNQIGVMTMGNTNWNDIKDDMLLIERNDDLNQLKVMLGLRYCCNQNELTTYYENPENYAKLRYDGVVLMTDNQTIIDLVMGYFDKYFPSLLERNFVVLDDVMIKEPGYD